MLWKQHIIQTKLLALRELTMCLTQCVVWTQQFLEEYLLNEWRVNSGDTSIVVRLWRAAMGRETHLFKGISKGRMRISAGTLHDSWFGKIEKSFLLEKAVPWCDIRIVNK